MKPVLHVGIDVGSTTVKVVALSPRLKLLFGCYERHMSNIRHTSLSLLKELAGKFSGYRITASISGSGGLGLSHWMALPFYQEILAETKAIDTFHPETDVIIELGGEDEKITYLQNGVDQRMNGACAGGTGAFIDRMATLLSTDAQGLNTLAEKSGQIYPIASRCGVFAKTDIQSLLNEGASHEDIARSIFQSVVNQTISGLTCGRPIRGKVAFLGGPLTFLPALRKQFGETLRLPDENMIVPEHGELYVAIGAAISAMHDKPFNLVQWLEKIVGKEMVLPARTKTMPSLFETEKDYEVFKARHDRFHTPRKNIKEASGPCWLGIDAGSTTIKAVLTDRDNHILYEYYAGNQGAPLESTRRMILDLYSKLPASAYICAAGTTGYGEDLIREALKADTGEVETIAHYRSALHFLPEVTTILDIGGQDMKCCRIKDGAVDNILLNESCSSGCGSFLDTFAQSLGMDIHSFSQMALVAKHPADLGSRCTVFMNSRVREAQKNGIDVADIAAGLCYSVIKNALYKVIRLCRASDLGEHIVVQGGTFYNDAVLRAFEKLLGQDVIRPDVAGLMGAYGMALISRSRFPETHRSSLISCKELAALSFKKEMKRCPGCGNHCLITLTTFSDNRTFISGNRCEKGASLILTGKNVPHSGYPNMYRWKQEHLFGRCSLSEAEAVRGTVGIPLTMNMYEDFPYWHAFFTKLGYRVITSSSQIRHIPTAAMETIPSYSECYPVKLAHAHIYDLCRKKPGIIWYPSVDRGPDEGGDHSYHCPMVTSYPETIQANMEEILAESGTRFMHPFVPLHSPRALHKVLKKIFCPLGISAADIAASQNAGEEAVRNYKNALRKETERILKEIEKNKWTGIILAGRPYHTDPAVHHGIPDLINQLGMAVLSEDGIAMISKKENPPLRVLNQWSWHSRLYKAADYVTRHPRLELVELNSFGCGLDAIVTDQVQEILSNGHRLFTSLKIDQSLNLGAVRIRLRSLKAAINERIKGTQETSPAVYPKAPFTKEMKKTFTILVPEMSPLHFPLIQDAARSVGYNIEMLVPGKADIDTGLTCVNNDACYPAIITIGTLIRALLSGKYDLSKTAVMLSQTGGACRASNYIALLHKALNESGLSKIPVISLNTHGLEPQSGFTLNLALASRLIKAVIYGDALQQCLYRTRPYEKALGSAEGLYKKWQKICSSSLLQNDSFYHFKSNITRMIKAFDLLPLQDIKRRPRIGIVGEIYVKFSPLASNDIVRAIESNGGEVETSGMLDFFLYGLLDSHFQRKHMDGSFTKELKDTFSHYLLEWYRKPLEDALKKSVRFHEMTPIRKMAKRASQFLSLGHRAGEGWFLTADMIDLLYHECRGIICLQPFGCLPNHITGEGMIHKLRKAYPEAVFLSLDCDAGTSEVNQTNRLKLMMNSLIEPLWEPHYISFMENRITAKKGSCYERQKTH